MELRITKKKNTQTYSALFVKILFVIMKRRDGLLSLEIV